MSDGKYSPILPKKDSYEFNAKGQVPVPYEDGGEWDDELMFPNYDDEGFDSYGYSAYDHNGVYVGVGNGVDRAGMTEYEYLVAYNEENTDFGI